MLGDLFAGWYEQHSQGPTRGQLNPPDSEAGRTSDLYRLVFYGFGVLKREVDEQTALLPHGAKIRS